MELIELISEQTPAVALCIVILFYYNRDSLRYLEERREMIETLRNERREWIEATRVLNQQYNDLLRTSVEAMSKMAAEMHALRGKLTEWMLGRNAGGND